MQLPAFGRSVLTQVLVGFSSLIHSVLEGLDFGLVFVAFVVVISLFLLADLDDTSHDLCCKHLDEEVLVRDEGHVESTLA